MENMIIKEGKEILSLNNTANVSSHKENNLPPAYVRKLSEIRTIIKEVIKDLNPGVLEEVVAELKQAPTINDFAEILKSIKYTFFQQRLYKSVFMMCEALSGNLKLPVSLIVVENVLYRYFQNKLSLCDKTELKGLEIMNIEGLYDSIFNYINEDFDQLSKANGIYDLSLKAVSQATEDTFRDSQNHLCFDCQNGFPSKCEKIADLKKKNIDKYDFIDRGYQVIDENGETDEFIVTKCTNFIGDPKVKKHNC